MEEIIELYEMYEEGRLAYESDGLEHYIQKGENHENRRN